MGLGVSGMTKATKVAGFLSIASKAWDPSLAFVMGGALLISTPVTVIFLNKQKKGAFSRSLSIPKVRVIEREPRRGRERE